MTGVTDEDHATALAYIARRATESAEMDALARELAGRQVLDRVHEAYGRYVAFPSPEALDAVVLFTAATHAQTVWEHATRLVIKSPVKRCGKTRTLEVGAELCHQVLKTTNISPAALVRSIGLVDPPTVMLDEADPVFATRRGERSEGAEDLRGLLNSGHSRGWPYIRWDATSRQREECPTFAMAVIAGIGDMPDTIEDRAVVVTMRRRKPGEHVEQFRRRRALGPLHLLREDLHEWVSSIAEALADAEPDLPVEDRAADVWEPLVAIADAAGGHWPARARRACIALCKAEVDDTADGNRLLADLYTVFGGDDRLSTATILERLNGDETTPWGGWHRGDGLNPRDLARMLKPYGVSPRKVRVGDADPLMGYRADDLQDSWSRYVPASRQEFRNGENMQNSPARDVPHVPLVPDVRLNGDDPSSTTDSDNLVAKDGHDLSTCTVCGQAMAVLEPGQTTHPLCEEF